MKRNQSAVLAAIGRVLFIGSTALCVPANPADAQVLFPAPVFSVGANPQSVAVADVNGDGKPDMVTANHKDGSVSVLLNQNAPTSVAVSGILTLEGIAANAAAQNVTFQFRPVGGGSALTRTQSVLPNGVFHFTALPPDYYNVWIKRDNYLASIAAVDARNGNFNGVATTLHAGDANNDNAVDILDFSDLVDAFGALINDGSGFYDIRADFNREGSVDVTDFGLLVTNYGESGAP